MDENKQIEEIIHTIKDVNTIYVQEVDKDGDYDIGYSDRYAVNKNVAEALYNAGYRKQGETVREFVGRLKKDLFAKCTYIFAVTDQNDYDMKSDEVNILVNELAKEYGAEVEE